MKFEVGVTYLHEAGKRVKIVGIIETDTYGLCYVGEDLKTGELIPVGMAEAHAENWDVE